MTLVSKLVRTVAWGDLDPAEIVFYPNYFRWFDEATHHLFDLAGVSQKRLAGMFGVFGTPLVEVKATFKAPSFYFDRIEIASHVSEWRNKTFVVSHAITNDGRLAVEGYEIRVWAGRHPDDPGRFKAAEIPERFKAHFEGPGKEKQ